jgi:tetratricopeptide (TPR) repeat protein
MQDKYIHILSIALVTGALVFIAFLYWSEPRSLAEVATKGQVATGTYSVDKAEADRGIASFNSERFDEARAAFARADPERRDPAVQFYMAYSYYRQGWGRVYNDDALFKQGLDAVNHVIDLDPNYRTQDASLGVKTPADLKHELEEGLKLTASDLNPMKLMRERK